MAVNFTISYTFTPSTTISSSEVNTNFSDEAAVWQGLEAVTKSLARLQVDATPTAAADVARKDYVDGLMNYRRPVLQYNSGTVINIETGLDGTAGDCTILFPDGDKRTDTTTGRIQCNLAQVAALSGSWQSGLRTGTVAANTWYSIYAVKTTDNTSHWVAVADTVIPTQGNFATLNSNFGTSDWVYLGAVPYGDNASATTAVPTFLMAGNTIYFTNACAVTGSLAGIKMAIGTTVTSVSYTYAAGTAAAQIPAQMQFGVYCVGKAHDGDGRGFRTLNQSGSIQYGASFDTAEVISSTWRNWLPLSPGILVTHLNSSSGSDWAITLAAYQDKVLGVGSNPVL